MLPTTSHEVKVRVRPPRIAVLTSTHTPHEEFIKTIQFLTMVRGGKFARFIYADMTSRDFIDFIHSEAKKFQPEIVIAASPEDKNLIRLFSDEARPNVLEIPTEPLQNFSEHATGGLLPWHRVVNEEYRKHPNVKRDNLFLLKINASEELQPLVAATYGLLPDDLTEYLRDKLQAVVHKTTVSTASELYALNALMAERYSWLDFLNKDMGLISSAWYPPTVVVAETANLLRDLGLYWNLRKHIAPKGSDESILLLRERDIDDRKTLKCLASTIGTSGIGSNFCHICTGGNNKSAVMRAARSLRQRLRAIKGKTYHVDTPTRFSAPTTYSYEKEVNITVSCDHNVVSISRTEPDYPSTSSFALWYVDFVQDQKSRRYPFDLALPKDVDVLDLLNIPAGGFFAFRNTLSFGNECLSVLHTSGENSSTVRFQIPSEQELFDIILHRAGWSLLLDEKNTRYSRFFDLFDSIHNAASALTGRPWAILNALVNGPLTYDTLRGKAKLGKRRTSEPLPEFVSMIRENYRGIYGEILERRIRSVMSEMLSENSADENIIEYLAKARVIFRKWLLDSCPGCNKAYWSSDLDITAALTCPGCNTYIPFKDFVRVGYELNPLATLAIGEGVRPVLLTARFIHNLTGNGCLWYPGAKIKKGSRKTDLDLLAIADEIPITGECKTLERNTHDQDAIWDELINQLALPIETARASGFRVFFVSSFVEQYPKTFQDRLKAHTGDSMILLFLTGTDLETGYRKYKDEDNHEQTLCLQTLLNRDSKRSRANNHNKFTRSMWF